MKRVLLLLLVVCALPAMAGPLEDAGLVDVQTVEDLPVYVSLRYAGNDNFTKRAVYPLTAACYLHKEAVEGLKKAVALAAQEEQPFTFCLWDCYRPQDAQEKLWKANPNPNYVTNPKKGSRHSRGMAVDLTPCDFNGTPLKMPTDFDTFSPRAHTDFQKLPPEVKARRETLKKIMTEAGFTPIRTEWWHFDKTGWKNKPHLNIPLAQ